MSRHTVIDSVCRLYVGKLLRDDYCVLTVATRNVETRYQLILLVTNFILRVQYNMPKMRAYSTVTLFARLRG